MNKRAKLSELPKSMADRAVTARKIACANPSAVQIDDEFLPWVYSEEDEQWYSFDGNYSAASPAEKKQKAEEQERKKSMYQEEALKKASIEYQRNLYWSKVRSDILKRDKKTCQLCNSKGNGSFHVHHIMKKASGGTDHYDNLITVCPACHAKVDHALYNPQWALASSKLPKKTNIFSTEEKENAKRFTGF